MKNGGYLLIAILVLGSLGIAGVSGLVSFANNNLSAARRAAESEQALQAAEAGIELYRQYLAEGGMATQGTSTETLLDGSGMPVGEYELAVALEPVGVRLTSAGRAGESVRTVEVILSLGDGISFSQGVQSGNGGFTLGNNSALLGNVYSNASIVGANGSMIEGDASAVGNISGVDVGGNINMGVEPMPLPIPESLIDEWKESASVSVHSGNRVFNGQSGPLGPVRITGDLVLTGSASIMVTGTVWVEGDILFGNNTSVALEASYGSGSGIIIADGDVTIENNVSFNGTGEGLSSILVVSTADSASAIDTGNNVLGELMLFAPDGTLNVGNNAEIRILAAEEIVLDNNAVLDYEQGTVNAVFISSSDSGWRMENWQEVR